MTEESTGGAAAPLSDQMVQRLDGPRIALPTETPLDRFGDKLFRAPDCLF